jgi:hypothetical protein
MIGTNDLESFSFFYVILLKELDIIRTFSGVRYIVYSKINNLKKIDLYFTKPFNKEVARNGNGKMIALIADKRLRLTAFTKLL